MNDYMDLADDKANIYQKGLWIIVVLGVLGGLFISYSLSQEMIVESRGEFLSPRITYETNSDELVVYSIVTVLTNVIFGFVMQFFVDMYKEMVMQRFMTHHMLQVFEKAKIE